MKQIIKTTRISNCYQCDYHVSFTGKCTQLNRLTIEIGIDKDCPLPDAFGESEGKCEQNIVPLNPGITLKNGGVLCDMRIGPCSCGAWHREVDYQWRLKNQCSFKSFDEILKRDLEGYDIPTIVDNLMDDQIIDVVKEYANQLKNNT